MYTILQLGYLKKNIRCCVALFFKKIVANDLIVSLSLVEEDKVVLVLY